MIETEEVPGYAFAYLLHRLVEERTSRLKQESKDEEYAKFMAPKEFNRLKSLKLLFFAAAVNANNEGDSLLDAFGEFTAYPQGPVVEEIYQLMKENRLPLFMVKKEGLEERPGENIDQVKECLAGVSPKTMLKIDRAIEELKKMNKELIDYSASVLVDITHKWLAWSLSMFTNDNLTSYQKMNKDAIKKECEVISLYYI